MPSLKLLERGARKAGFPRGQSGEASPRVKVIRSLDLNAFALPHGVIYVHTGMLARMENEDQLATVLGHEQTHFTHRHTLRDMRKTQNTENVVFALQMLIFTAAAGAGVINTGLLDRKAGDFYACGSEWILERPREEADTVGFKLMVDAAMTPVNQ